jgi:Icc protein
MNETQISTVHQYSAAAERDFQLVQITDIHFARDPAATLGDINMRASLADVLARLRAEPGIDAVLATGDLSDDASPESYVALREALQGLEIPVFCLAGNHDDISVMEEYLLGGWVTRAPAVNFGHWQVISVDTQVDGRVDGEIGAQRLETLAMALAEDEARHALIALHHPPVSVGSRWMDAMGLHDAGAFWRTADRSSRLRAVIWGHIHQEFAQTRGDVQLFSTPSTCVQYAPGARQYTVDDRPAGYRRLRLTADGQIHSEVVRVVSSITQA